MGGYFKSWRRKIGTMTLLMACVLTAGWIRSQFHDDTVVLLVGKTRFFNFISNQNCLGARACSYGTDISTIKILWLSHAIDPAVPKDLMENVSVPIRLDFPGFHFGCKGHNLLQRNYFAVVFISYWYLISPLTLLSAWLLLSRSGKTPNAILADPTSETEA